VSQPSRKVRPVDAAGIACTSVQAQFDHGSICADRFQYADFPVPTQVRTPRLLPYRRTPKAQVRVADYTTEWIPGPMGVSRYLCGEISPKPTSGPCRFRTSFLRFQQLKYAHSPGLLALCNRKRKECSATEGQPFAECCSYRRSRS
jgi:hypothetical protein